MRHPTDVILLQLGKALGLVQKPSFGGGSQEHVCLVLPRLLNTPSQERLSYSSACVIGVGCECLEVYTK